MFDVPCPSRHRKRLLPQTPLVHVDLASLLSEWFPLLLDGFLIKTGLSRRRPTFQECSCFAPVGLWPPFSNARRGCTRSTVRVDVPCPDGRITCNRDMLCELCYPRFYHLIAERKGLLYEYEWQFRTCSRHATSSTHRVSLLDDSLLLSSLHFRTLFGCRLRCLG